MNDCTMKNTIETGFVESLLSFSFSSLFLFLICVGFARSQSVSFFKKDYDFDTTKQRGLVIRYPVNFEDSVVAEEPETDGDLVHQLSKIALGKYNDEKLTNLELVRAVKANRQYGGGYIFFITFETKDANSQPIPFHATVGYLPGDVIVYSVNPKP